MIPVDYKQTDARWKNKDYSAKGESTTIGASGCGPSSMAMVLATLADKTVTPETECAWALKNGFKCPHSGTYYGYFVPAGKRYGIKLTQLNSTSIYGNNSSLYHDRVKTELQKGNWVIACMGKGLWTSSGHYILAYDWQDNIIKIRDPASTKASRLNGDWSLFKKQVKYYWVIEVPKESEEEDLTEEQTKKLIRQELTDYIKKSNMNMDFVHVDKEISDGSRLNDYATRGEVIEMIHRLKDYLKKEN